MNIRYPIYEGVYRILTIELNSGKDKFIVNVNSISYVERSDLSGSVVHFAYSRSDATAVLYVDQSLDQIRELIAE